SFHSTLNFGGLPISLKASYSQPIPSPVFGSAKLSGVYAFSVTATTLRPARSGGPAALATPAARTTDMAVITIVFSILIARLPLIAGFPVAPGGAPRLLLVSRSRLPALPGSCSFPGRAYRRSPILLPSRSRLPAQL